MPTSSSPATLAGVVPIIPIPFHADESIDEVSLRRTIDWVAAHGLGGMGLPAYGSEFYKLSEAERDRVVEVAVEVCAGRIPVVAQANHGSARGAVELARRYAEMGADIIAFAIPRQFASTNEDLMRYCGAVADAVDRPILIQDFNPGGPTIGAPFIQTLHRHHGNFRYAKLEEPLIVDKLISIRDAVGDDVGILEGWGGYYMMEAIPEGIAGIMPGVPFSDLLDVIFQARRGGDDERAYDLFGAVLPMISFTLQDMEVFHQVEKRIAVRRGLFDAAHVRAITWTPSDRVCEHIEFLIDQLIRVLRSAGLEP